MFDVITLGTATKDSIIVADNLKSNEKYLLLEEGKKLEIKKPIIETGGGATNTAVAFSRLGLKTGIITKIGNDNTGLLVKKSLIDEGVNINLISEDSKEGTAFSTIITKTGKDRAILVYRGASCDLEFKDIKLHELNTKWLYVSALSGNSVKVLKSVFEYCHRNNVNIAMNPGAKELEMPSLLKYVKVLLLNYEEARKLSGKKNVNEILKKLGNYGPRIIAITNGEKVIHVLYYNKILHALPCDVKVVSTLGAGDAFCSGFVAALIHNASIDSAIRLGLLNSASVIQYFGAKHGLLKLENIMKFKKKVGKIHTNSIKL